MVRMIDIGNKRFGRLLVIERGAARRHGIYWRCLCDCGNVTEVYGTDLRGGKTKSCGCLKGSRTHGFAYRGKKTPEYRIWVKMRQRCANPTDKAFHRYGGRGIVVCDRWSDFPKFFADMGPRPSPLHSVERINSNGHYEPDNCRWATQKEQSNNTSRNIMVEFRGKQMTLMQAVELVGENYDQVYDRFYRGRSISDLGISVIGRRG